MADAGGEPTGYARYARKYPRSLKYVDSLVGQQPRPPLRKKDYVRSWNGLVAGCQNQFIRRGRPRRMSSGTVTKV